MFGIREIKQNIEVLRLSGENLFHRFRELYHRVDSLYATDRFGTERPKIDMLTERLDKAEVNLMNALTFLGKKIEELNIKKVKK